MVDAEHLPAVAAPMALAFPAPRPRHRPPHHRTFYAHPSAHAHPHPSERGPMHASVHLQVHAYACGSSPPQDARPCDATMGSFSFDALILSSPRLSKRPDCPSAMLSSTRSPSHFTRRALLSALHPRLRRRRRVHPSSSAERMYACIHPRLGGGGGCIRPRQPNACMHASIHRLRRRRWRA